VRSFFMDDPVRAAILRHGEEAPCYATPDGLGSPSPHKPYARQTIATTYTENE
jgi:hypothetical protein